MRREFPADHRIQTARRAMPPNHVPSCDRSRRPARLRRQWPNSGVRVQHAIRKTRRTGEHALRLGREIRDLVRIDRSGAGIAVEAFVRGADQQQIVPRQNEKRPPVRARFNVHAGTRCAGKRRYDHVTALGAAEQPRVVDRP